MPIAIAPNIPRELWAIWLATDNVFVPPVDADAPDAMMCWTTLQDAEDGLAYQIAADYVTSDSRPTIVRIK